MSTEIDHFLASQVRDCVIEIQLQSLCATPFDVQLTVNPNVWMPKAGEITFMLDFLNRSKDWLLDRKRVLDMGCGTGILGIFSLLCGAREAVLSDVSSVSVDNTRLNLARLGFYNCSVIESDLFTNLDSTKKFDTIIFNHPFFATLSDRAGPLAIGTASRASLLSEFFVSAKAYLVSNRYLIMNYWGDDEFSPHVAAEIHGWKATEQFCINLTFGNSTHPYRIWSITV